MVGMLFLLIEAAELSELSLESFEYAFFSQSKRDIGIFS